MTTLKYFFDVKNAEENRKLFKDLYIEKSEYFKEQGQYPVIFITMKDLKKNTWEQMYFAAKSLISNLYNEFEFIREKLNEKDLIEFEKIWFKKEDGDYDNSLRLLSEYLYNYYQKEVVLLIDEYDNPFFTFEELSKFDGIWQLMIYNGYLKISEKISNDEYMIKIPNYEIQTFFKKGFIDKFLVSGKKRKNLKVRM